MTLCVLFFDTAGAKKRTKRNAEIISRLRARGGLCALHPHKLLKKFDQNFHHVLSFSQVVMRSRKSSMIFFSSLDMYDCEMPR